MKSTSFNHLPLNQRAAMLFPAAELVSSNENEAFRISFYMMEGMTYEVCIDLDSQTIEDIRLIEERAISSTIRQLIYS
jgi:hypothetical protein